MATSAAPLGPRGLYVDCGLRDERDDGPMSTPHRRDDVSVPLLVKALDR